MARDDAPPFGRGETWYNGTTIDTNDLGGAQHEGKEYVFEDLDWGNTAVGARPARTNQKVVCKIVRNKAAAALLPKRLVTFKAGQNQGQVDGYARTGAVAPAFPVDEFLPAAGVPVNDLFYIVTQGPATCLTDLAGGAGNVITENDPLVALTGATSGATTAGRVRTIDLTGATSVLGGEILGMIGRALSAKTTGQTNGDVLVEIGKW